MLKADAAFEAVSVVLGVFPRRVRPGQAKQGTEFSQEELVVGPLATGGGGPAGDEGPNQGGVKPVIRGWVVRRQDTAI